MKPFTKYLIADATRTWLKALGYAVLYGPAFAACRPGAKRGGPYYRRVSLVRRMWVSEKCIGRGD